ncbi:glycosyltransferase family 4 protein [Algiphilus sp. NNCM1]|uniref:glycosyltransferase n=1 Tax=Algiphilus sp. TaxID=1872431 RepID=UPI001CA6FB8D|nr:glycosyltransferase [Algiphilus sp.]MBY8965047.1 glycosyltransferase family 4 protein [Algiphilus acroporae]MCI5104201.1 glycosyltransferase [Algiphilus sp.]
MAQALSISGHDVLLSINGGDFEREVEAVLGEKPMFRFALASVGRNGRSYWRRLLGLVGEVLLLKPQWIYTRTPEVALLAAVLRCNVALEWHGINSLSARRRAVLRWLSVLGRRIQHISITSKLAMDLESRYGINVSAILPDGSRDMYKCRPPPYDGKRRLKVGYFGSAYPGKGVERVLRIADQLKRCEFHLFGPTESDSLIFDRCDAANVFPHGPFANHDFGDYASQMDILINPAEPLIYSDRNGGMEISRWTSPLKVFEYMSAGRMVLSSDTPGAVEVLKGTPAMIIEASSDEAWTAALMKCVEMDSAELGRSGELLRSIFLEKYSWTRRASKLLLLMDEHVA